MQELEPAVDKDNNGRYRMMTGKLTYVDISVGRALGKGSFGVTHDATIQNASGNDTTIALKIIRTTPRDAISPVPASPLYPAFADVLKSTRKMKVLATTEALLQAFLSCQSAKHPTGVARIPRIFFVAQNDNQTYLGMEALNKTFERAIYMMTIREFKDVLLTIARKLEALQSEPFEFVHGDLHLDNVMLDRANVAYIIDFGFSGITLDKERFVFDAEIGSWTNNAFNRSRDLLTLVWSIRTIISGQQEAMALPNVQNIVKWCREQVAPIEHSEPFQSWFESKKRKDLPYWYTYGMSETHDAFTPQAMIQTLSSAA